MFGTIPHQYVERSAGRVLDEALFGDRVVRFLYSRTRERAPALFRAFTRYERLDFARFNDKCSIARMRSMIQISQANRRCRYQDCDLVSYFLYV